MPPIAGFLIKGAEVSDTSTSRRGAEAVNADLVRAYQEIAEKSGIIIAREVLLTPLTGNLDEGDRYRQDTHLIVDYQEQQ